MKLPKDSARWCQDLAKAMVDAELSLDAAARLWGLKRNHVQQLLRSDTVDRPAVVEQWLKKKKRAAIESFPSESCYLES